MMAYKEIFDHRASPYEEAMAAQPRARDAEFQLAVGGIQGGLNDPVVLDMPSGGGYLNRHLPQAMDVVSLDPSFTFSALAAHNGVCSITQGRMERLPFRDGSFDVIISLAGLHHQPELGEVFAEARRVLDKENGQMIVCEVEKGTPPARFLNGFVDRHNVRGHEGRFVDGETHQVLSGAGFRIQHSAYYRYTWNFPNESAMVEFCRKLFGLNATDQQIRTELRGTLGVDDSDEGCHLQWGLRRFICRPDMPGSCRDGIGSALHETSA